MYKQIAHTRARTHTHLYISFYPVMKSEGRERHLLSSVLLESGCSDLRLLVLLTLLWAQNPEGLGRGCGQRWGGGGEDARTLGLVFPLLHAAGGGGG